MSLPGDRSPGYPARLCPWLRPVPPLPSLPELPPRRLGPSALAKLLAVVVLVSLGLNGWLLWNQRDQNARLARLEASIFRVETSPTADRPGPEEAANPATGRLPRRATTDTRLAALLAVAGDDNRCRRLLDSLSPAECVEVGQALIARPPAGDRNGALAAVVSFLAGTNPEQAAGLLDGVQEAVLRTTLARQLMETWTASHADAAAQWLAGDGMRFLDAAAASGPMVRAITQWASFAPEAATKFVAGQPPDRGPISRVLSLASRAWGQLDPAAALAWVNNTLPVADQRHGQALQGVWEGWAERDPAQAGTALRQQFYAGTNGLPVELAGTVGKQWAQSDPAAAAQWAVTLPANGARSNALYQVAMVWTQADAPGAARWAATLPASNTRAQIWREIVGDWADNDPAAAGAWLGGLPLGRDHDEAVAAYLPKVEPTEPERALAWAGTVSDPGIRSDQVQRVLGAWERRDPAAARNWAAANAVPILPARTTGP